MNKQFKEDSALSCVAGLSEVVGTIERVLYVVLVVSEMHHVIIGWLALKALQNPFKEAVVEDAKDGTATNHDV